MTHALSLPQKEAGRRFRAAASAALAATFTADPPCYTVPHFLAVFRHTCTARGAKSTALELAEVYQLSPADAGTPAGFYAFLYRTGRCRHCGATARSRTGRLVIAAARPPLSTPVQFRYGDHDDAAPRT